MSWYLQFPAFCLFLLIYCCCYGTVTAWPQKMFSQLQTPLISLLSAGQPVPPPVGHLTLTELTLISMIQTYRYAKSAISQVIKPSLKAYAKQDYLSRRNCPSTEAPKNIRVDRSIKPVKEQTVHTIHTLKYRSHLA